MSTDTKNLLRSGPCDCGDTACVRCFGEPDTTQGGIDLDPIEAREQAARPGPWTMRDDLDGQGYPGHLWIVENDEDKVDEEFGVAISIGTEDDAAFIAHARTDVGDLLREARRLNVVVELLGSHLQGGAEDVKAVARSAEAEIDRLRAALAFAAAEIDDLRVARGHDAEVVQVLAEKWQAEGYVMRDRCAEELLAAFGVEVPAHG